MAACLLLSAISGCTRDAQRQVAQRILDRHRRATGSKPLPASHVVRQRLFPDSGDGERGTREIAWEPGRYRERTMSAGVATERGLQGGRAYYTDEDGVTRVVSEPVVRELLTKSFFWRRAWLFADVERARLAVGPSDAATVSVRLRPKGGNELLLVFSPDGRLLSARSPGFRLDLTRGSAFREWEMRRPPIRGEIAWTGLPTGRLPDATVGGGCARFAAAATAIPFERTGDGGVVFGARVGGVPLRLRLDAAADGPAGLSPAAAARLGASFVRDTWGRRIAAGVRFEAGALSCAGVHVAALDSAPEGVDGIVGATVFRDTVVELDPAGRLCFHDPERWVAPAGFTRTLVDDDGNRPVATLRRRGEPARVLVGGGTSAADLRLASEAARRLRADLPGRVAGLHWGPVELPEVTVAPETRRTLAEWGDDGTLGFPLLLRFHVYLDMPHRWVYLRPRSD